MEKMDVQTIQDEKEKGSKLREALHDVGTSSGTTTLYFLKKLEMVKMHVQKTREALENGLNQKGTLL